MPADANLTSQLVLLPDASGTRCQSYHRVGLTLSNRCHPYHRIVSISAAIGNPMSHAYVIESWNADSCWPLLLLFRRINLDEEKVLLVSVYVYVSDSVLL
jgi:hypothetical protein